MGLRAFLGTLRAVWDISEQLVQLHAGQADIRQDIDTLRDDLDRLDERTRKQRYRDRQTEEAGPSPPAPQPDLSDPLAAKVALIRQARAQGLIR